MGENIGEDGLSFVLFRVCYARRARDPEKRIGRLLERLRKKVPELEPSWVQPAPFFPEPEVGVLVRLPLNNTEDVLDRLRQQLEGRRLQFEEQRLVAEEQLLGWAHEPFLERADIERKMEAGKSFCHLGMLDEGLVELQACLEAEPSCTEAYHYLVAIVRQLGRSAEAEPWLSKGLSDHQESPSYLFLYASVLQDVGKHTEALTQLKKAIRLDPDSGVLYCSLASTLHQLGHIEPARLAYEEALAKQSDLSEAALGLGGMLLEQGALDEAAEWLTRTLSIDGECIEARLKLGWCYLHMGESNSAEVEFLQVANGPVPDYHLPARFSLGRLYVLESNFAMAEEILDEVCEQQPDLGEAHRFLAEAASALGHEEKALIHWRKACELLPESALALRPYLALAMSRCGQLEDAKTVVDELLSAIGPRADLYELMASIHVAAEEWEEAREALAQGEGLDPESALLAFQQGWVAENLDDIKAALAYYNRAVRLDPELFEAYCGLGWLYYEMGDYDVALVLFEQAHELQPTNPELLDHVGWVQLLLGNFREALDCFNRALRLEPDCDFFQSHQGAALFHMGLFEHARIQLEEVLTRDPIPLVEAFARYVLGLVYREEGHEQQALEQIELASEVDELPPEFVDLSRRRPQRAGRNVWKSYRTGSRKDQTEETLKVSNS